MTASARHLIRKQTLEFSASTLPLAQRWEQKSADLLQGVITPCLEDCFDRVAGAGDHVVIDRLEIDLGEITERNYKQVVPERLRAALDKALGDLVAASPTAAASGFAAGTRRPRRMSEMDAAVEAFIFYLRYGVLPWWFDRSGVNETIWNAQWISGLGAAGLRKILVVLAEASAARRLVERFDDETLGHVVASSLDLSADDIAVVWTALAFYSAESDEPRRRRLRLQYWREWFEAGVARLDFAACAGRFSGFVLRHQPLRESALRLLAPNGVTVAVAEAGPGLFIQEVLEAVRLEIPRYELKRGTGDFRPPTSGDADGVGVKDAFPNESEEKRFDTDTDVDNEAGGLNEKERSMRAENFDSDEASPLPQEALRQGIFVQDAGLVLLHPFLPELFAECGLWRNGSWRETASARMAVHLLDWLANGDQPQPEYRLPLHKILCGIAIEEPLPPAPVPDCRQQDSCIALLNAVVQHWGALGNTSPDGLREGFLRREGLLQAREQGWKLTVEKKAQDVLLGRLPWGISLIQLPWMDRQRIFVDWL